MRLFELFRGPHATALIFGDAAADAPEGVPAYRILPAGGHPAVGEFLDAEGHAFGAYGVDDSRVVAIVVGSAMAVLGFLKRLAASR